MAQARFSLSLKEWIRGIESQEELPQIILEEQADPLLPLALTLAGLVLVDTRHQLLLGSLLTCQWDPEALLMCGGPCTPQNLQFGAPRTE